MSNEDRGGANKLTEWLREKEYLAELWSAPSREVMIRYDNNAYDTAKLVLQYLFLVHGGALVAVPTFAKMAPGGSLSNGAIAALVVTFMFGLSLTFLAALFTFFACTYRSDESFSLVQAYHARAWAWVADKEHSITGQQLFKDGAEQSKLEAEKLDKSATSSHITYLRNRAIAILLIMGSMGAVVLAGGIGAYSVITSTPSNERPSNDFRIPMWD